MKTAYEIESLAGQLASITDVDLKAQGTFVLQSGDFTLRLAPAADSRLPAMRELSLSGPTAEINRDLRVRVVAVVPSNDHPWSDETDGWVVHDLGELQVGRSTTLEVYPEATFRLAFADPSDTTICIELDEDFIELALPDSGHPWVTYNYRYFSRPDADIPEFAYLLNRAELPHVSPATYDVMPLLVGGELQFQIQICQGGAQDGTAVETSSWLLEEASVPLGLLRISLSYATGVAEETVTDTHLLPMVRSQSAGMLWAEVSEQLYEQGNGANLMVRGKPLLPEELTREDVMQIRQLLGEDTAVYRSDFPNHCLRKLEQICDRVEKGDWDEQ